LVALLREALLAKNVLQGKTRGYKNHPQLLRFKNSFASISGLPTIYKSGRISANLICKKYGVKFKSPTTLEDKIIK
jgi:hypothetical protein